jgi:hypothetical protein
MQLNESVIKAFEEACSIKEQRAILDEKEKAAKKIIRTFMEENKLDSIRQDGFSARITPASRSSLIKAEVAKRLGGKIPEECISWTHYTTLTVDRDALVLG